MGNIESLVLELMAVENGMLSALEVYLLEGM